MSTQQTPDTGEREFEPGDVRAWQEENTEGDSVLIIGVCGSNPDRVREGEWIAQVMG